MNILSGEEFMNKLHDNVYRTGKYEKKSHLVKDEDITDIGTHAKELHNKIKKLNQYKPDAFDRTKMKRELTKFKDSYNALKKKYGSVEDNHAVTKELKKIDDLLTENENDLKKIGIKKNKKGLLEFDADKFNAVKENTINKLFDGSKSFFKLSAKVMKRVENVISSEEYQTETVQVPISNSYSNSEMSAADTIIKLNTSLRALKGYDDNYQKMQENDIVDQNCNDEKKLLCQQLNEIKVIKGDENVTKLVSQIYDFTREYYEKEKETFHKNGLAWNEETDELSENILVSDAIDIKSFHQLFGSDEVDSSVGEFASQLQNLSLNLFQELMKTNKVGVQIDRFV